MKSLLLALFFCLLASFARSLSLTDAEYVKMPQLFHLDDFDSCLMHGEEALYCSITFQLAPIDSLNSSESWRVLEKAKQIRRYYRHDKIRHGICVTTTCPNISKEVYYVGDHDENLERELSSCYSDKYRELGLKGQVIEMHCENHEPFYKIDEVDKYVGCALLSFVLLVIYASFYDGLAKYKNKTELEKKKTFGKLISCFSIPKNFNRLSEQTTAEDDVQLRNIQGLRFFAMIVIVFAHLCVTNSAAPTVNPKFNEDVTLQSGNIILMNGGFFMQMFFSISGMLVSYSFFKRFDGKTVTMGYFVLAFVYRYIRFTAVLLVMVGINATWMVHAQRGPVWDKIVGNEYRNCRANWWTNLLYLNNYINKEKMCLFQTWYLAADIQVFLVALMVIYLMLVYRQHIKTIMFASIFISILIPYAVSYYNEFEIITKFYPEDGYNSMEIPHQYHITYLSAYCNMGGYMVGVAFGYAFYLYRKSNMFTRKIYIWIWWILISTLPMSVLSLAVIFYQDGFYTTPLWSAAYDSFGKPIFAFGVMLCILGMVQGQGWFLHWLLEWAPIQILGRVTFCVYLVHMTLQKVRVGDLRRPIYITSPRVLFQGFGDTTVAFIFGTLLCLFVELPISALKKFFIPDKKMENKKPEKRME